MSAQKICPQCGTEYDSEQRFCPKDGSTLRSQESAEDLIGSIIADRYHVLRKIGEGGMGSVYLAEHVKMGRKSAVKVMNKELVNNADAISRFNREASNASKINHPNVCAVYDFGETADGLTYLAMEFIEGPSLTKVIADQGALPPHRAAEIARQVADALSVAHDMGIVHRDLKPDNIMLARNRDESDLAKVVDFGIAKVATNEAQKVTKTGLVIGTPEYMSPEQLAGDPLDGRSDIYSLGLVSFHMLTGKLPFPANSLQESMIMRLTEKPKQLAEMKDDVAWSPQLQAVLDRALERSADARYQTAAEFGREFHKAVKAMHDSSATAVIDRASPPESIPATRMSDASKSVPPTRVGSATPHQASPAVVRKSKSKVPMVAGIAVGVLAIGTAGAYFATQNNRADTVSPRPNTSARAPSVRRDTSASAPTPDVSLQRQLDSISPLTADTVATKQSADSALALLAQIESVARGAGGTSFLHFRFLRAKAMVSSDQVQPGCDSLTQLESIAKETRFERALGFVLSRCRQP